MTDDVAERLKSSVGRAQALTRSLKMNRPKTLALPPEEANKLERNTGTNKKSGKFRIVTSSVEIDGVEYTRKVFIPLESKQTRFLKKLNKKERPISMAKGK